MNDQVPQLDVQAAITWIRTLHEDTGGLITVNSHGSDGGATRADWHGRFYDLSHDGTDEAITRYLRERDRLNVMGVYLGQSSVLAEPAADSRTTAEGAHRLPGLWMDGDIAGPAHEWEPCEGGANCIHPSKKGGPAFGEPDFVRKHAGKTLPLPPDIDAMLAVAMEAGYPLPTYLQDSGNGLNGYWLFDVPPECPGGRRGPIGQLSERFQRQLEAAGQRIRDPRTPDGVKYGPLPDLARVMRLPGTVNRKPGTPGGARMSRIIPGGTGRRFTVAEFETMIERAEAKTGTFRASMMAAATAVSIAVTGVQGALPFAAPAPLPADRVKISQENSPQDDFNRRADWIRDIFGPHGRGWQEHSRPGNQILMTRPGKDIEDGYTASINGTGADQFRAFGSNCEPFTQGEGYTKSGVIRALLFGGEAGDPDFVQTNRWLRSQGYGDPLPPREWVPPTEPDMSTLVDPLAGVSVWDAEPVDTGVGLTPEEEAEAARLLAVQQRAEKVRARAEDERIRREAKRLVDSEDMAALQATRRLRLVDGWDFLREDPDDDEEQAIWGAGPQWMWAPGEPMMMFGGNGVYKSTLSHLLVFARLGLLGPDGRPRADRMVTDEDHPDDWGRVLGMPVQPMAHGTTLIYLAGDRPRQIRRAMRRHRREWMREILAERLIVHEGPLPFELTTNKDGLADLAMERKGSDVFVDSLKDYCPKPSEDESANGYNRARQECIARGMQWVEDHHNRKIAQGQARTNGIEDVYGSRWLTAGAGSVVSMWCDEEGSAVVHVKQVKSPGEFVPELEVTVNKPAGTMGAATKQDPISFIRSAGLQGITAAEYATFTGLAVNAARNQLNTRTGQGVLEKVPGAGPADKLTRYRVRIGVMPQTVQNPYQVDGLGQG